MHQRFALRMRERASGERRKAVETRDANTRALHLELAREFDARAAEAERGTAEMVV